MLVNGTEDENAREFDRFSNVHVHRTSLKISRQCE